jgi:D-amino peptidase
VVRQHIADGYVPHATRAQAKPVDCELRVQTSALADLFCQWPTLTRVDAVTLRFGAASAEHAVRMLNCLSAMSFMLR